jgi:hypothetical protein
VNFFVVLYGDVGVIQVCFVSANGRMYLFWEVKWDISNSLSFGINVDVMRVYVVGANGPVPSCFWWAV